MCRGSFDSKSQKYLNVIEIHDLQCVEIDKSAEIRDRATQTKADENSEKESEQSLHMIV